MSDRNPSQVVPVREYSFSEYLACMRTLGYAADVQCTLRGMNSTKSGAYMWLALLERENETVDDGNVIILYMSALDKKPMFDILKWHDCTSFAIPVWMRGRSSRANWKFMGRYQILPFTCWQTTFVSRNGTTHERQIKKRLVRIDVDLPRADDARYLQTMRAGLSLSTELPKTAGGPFPIEFNMANESQSTVADVVVDDEIQPEQMSEPVDAADTIDDASASDESQPIAACNPSGFPAWVSKSMLRNKENFIEPTQYAVPTEPQLELILDLLDFLTTPNRCPSVLSGDNLRLTIAPLIRWIVGEGVQFQYTPTRFKAGEFLTLETDVATWRRETAEWIPNGAGGVRTEHGWGSTHPLGYFEKFKVWKLTPVDTTPVSNWDDSDDSEETPVLDVSDSEESMVTTTIVVAGERSQKRQRQSVSINHIQTESRKRMAAIQAEREEQDAVVKRAATRCQELDAAEAREHAEVAAKIAEIRESAAAQRRRDIENQKFMANRNHIVQRKAGDVFIDTEQLIVTSELLGLFLQHIDPEGELKYLYKGDDVSEHTLVFDGVTRHADFYASMCDGADGIEIVAECKPNITNASSDSMFSQLFFYQRALATTSNAARLFLACYPREPKPYYLNFHRDVGHRVWWPALGSDCVWVRELINMLNGGDANFRYGFVDQIPPARA